MLTFFKHVLGGFIGLSLSFAMLILSLAIAQFLVWLCSLSAVVMWIFVGIVALVLLAGINKVFNIL